MLPVSRLGDQSFLQGALIPFSGNGMWKAGAVYLVLLSDASLRPSVGRMKGCVCVCTQIDVYFCIYLNMLKTTPSILVQHL